MKRLSLLFVLLVCGLLSAKEDEACQLNTKAILPSGETGIRMENGKVALAVNPNQGAGCLAFTDKETGTNYTTGDNNFPMFGDRILELGWNALLNLSFAWKVIENTPEKVSVEFRREGLPQFQYITLTRVITLKKDSATVEVKESFYNDPAGMAPVVVTPYFRQGTAIPGKETFFYIPTENGVQTNTNKKGGGTIMFKNASSGFGAVGDGKGNGLAFEYDFRHLAWSTSWLSNINVSCLEWSFVPVRIETGKSFTTTYTITPYHGISVPAGAKNGITGGIKNGKLQLCSGKDVSGELFIGKKSAGKISLKNGVPAEFPLLLSGQNLAQVRLKSGKKSLLNITFQLTPKGKVPPECAKVKAAEQIVQELKLSGTFVTPHIPWAKPHIGGKLKLLILCDYQQQREAVELAQRLDCEFKVIRISHISSQMSWGMVDHFGTFSFKDANSALRMALKNEFDAVVVSGNLLRFVEADNLKSIRKKLERGAGLMLIQPYDMPDSFKELLLMDSRVRPGMLEGEWLPAEHLIAKGWAPELTQPGKQCKSAILPGAEAVISSVNGPVIASGIRSVVKVVQTSYYAAGALLPVYPLESELAEYNYPDYQFVPVIKSILFAAGKLPSAFMKAERQKNQVILQFNGFENLSGCTLNLTLRNLLTGKTEEKNIVLKGNEVLCIPAENVPGTHTAEYRLLKDGKIMDFGFSALEIKPETKLLAMSSDKSLYHAGENIQGKLSFSGKPERIALRLEDAEGRLIAESRADAEGNFTLNIPEASTRMMTVRARAYQNGVLQSEKRHTVYTKVSRPVPEYAISGSEHEWMWDINRKFRPYFFKELRRQTGYDLMRLWTFLSKDRGIPAFKDYMRFDFPWNVSILTGFRLRDFAAQFQKPYHQTGNRKYLERVPCFHDPAWLTKRSKMIQDTLKLSHDYTPAQFSYGDELSLTHFGREHDFCFSKHTLAAFRKHLKEMYGSLEKLNVQWETAYTDWNKIIPPTTPEARKTWEKTGNASAWVDFRDFMDQTFPGFFVSSTQVARKLGYRQIVDISGVDSGNAYSGKQWYRLNQAVDQVAPYISGDIGDQIRSFFRGSVIPWNAGYSAAGNILNYRIWNDAFMFKKGGSSFYSTRNTLYPDYTIQPGTRDWANATYDLRHGLGALRATLDEEEPEVLILQSQNAMYVSTLLQTGSELSGARMGWNNLAVDLDLKFRYFADQELENGILRTTSARVVILPFALALSEKSCGELRDFVEKGGILIADRLPGITDEHGKLMKKGQLDDLFGLIQPDKQGSRASMVKIGSGEYMRQTGWAKGKNTDFLIENRFGKGKTLYLNFSPGSYSSLRNNYTKESAEILNMQKEILRAVNGRQLKSYRFRWDGKDPIGGRIYSYRQKGAAAALFIGAVRDNKANGPAVLNLEFPEPRYVYDMRKGTATETPAAKWSGKLNPAQSVFLAVLPKKIGSFQLKAPDSIGTGKEFRYEIALPDTELEHVYEVTVTGPDGKYRRLYSQILHATKGNCTGSFRTALNDQTGTWILTVRNVLTGEKKPHTFEVKAER